MLSLTNRAAFGCLIPVASGKVKAAAASQKLPLLPTDLLPALQKLRARDAPAPAQLWEGDGEAGAQLLAHGDQALLVGGGALLVLNLGFDVVGGVQRRGVEYGCRARLHGGLRPALGLWPKRKSASPPWGLRPAPSRRAPVFGLLARGDQSLMVRGNALLVLSLSVGVVNGVRRLDVERDCLAHERPHEDLHPPPERHVHLTESGISG